MSLRFKEGDFAVINTKAKDLSCKNGILVEVIEVLPFTSNHDYKVEYVKMQGNRVTEKLQDGELQEIKDDRILQLEYGQKVIYTPLDIYVIVDQINYLYGQVAIRFPDDGVQVVGLETLRLKEIPTRKSWDDYFMDIALKVATRATCDRLHVGCVIVKDKKIVSTGYNGSIFGKSHCDEVGHLYNDQKRCIRTIHAEQNAILYANREDLKGATAYVTHHPCENCAKLLVQSGIKKVVYLHSYENKYSDYFLNMIESVHLKGE